ncbi:MAG TPA: DNA internalization-related competence protein ComEC/Rec2 [Acidiferrobacterales bacterium]|nr:DNA internalization-related competence protein ComEC/Rec2 [Acidiferrobacterales bacterium]
MLQSRESLPSLWWGLLLIPFALFYLWLRLKHGTGDRRSHSQSFSRLFFQHPAGYLLPVLFFIAGFFWAALRADILLQDALPEELEGKDLWVEGYIADLPKQAERGVSFKFDVRRAYLNGAPVAIPHKIQLNLFAFKLALRVGDQWGFLARLKRPHGFQNPGGFDYEAYLFRERIRATGYIRKDKPPELMTSDPTSYPVGRFRQYLGEQIHRALPENDFTGVLTAFVNGDETDISDKQWEVFQRTGTTHLVAISGMNIGFLAGLVFLLVNRLWAWPGFTVLYWPAPKLAAVAAVLAAIGYAALAGFAIPTQRALIMLLIVMVGVLAQRAISASHLLAAALFAVLFYDPLAVMSAGFWLSFVSVGVILFSISSKGQEHSWWHRWGKIQWVIAIGLLPLMLVVFQRVALNGPVANMLAIPVIELIVIPLALLGAIFLLFLPDAVSVFIFKLAALALQALWKALDYLASFDQAQWIQHRPAAWTVVCAAIGILWLLAPRGWPVRWVGVVWLLPMFLPRPAAPQAEEVWFTLLDVGQGLSAVVRTQGHTLVYDTGARFSSRFDAGRAVLLPYLRAMGVSNIDMLIVSHGDNDHIGGAKSLLASMPVREIISSVPERLPQAQYCKMGQSWRWEGVEFSIISPVNETDAHGNNACCVLLITSRYGNILLPGDIESRAEKTLVQRWGDKLSAEVLIVPHHGSKTSSTTAFIKQVHPAIALFPVGYRNPYRHPNKQVVKRYITSGIEFYDSVSQGAVEILLRDGGIEASGYRQLAKRYWFTEHKLFNAETIP